MTTQKLPKRVIACITATCAVAAIGSSVAATSASAAGPGCNRETADLQRRLAHLHYTPGRADGCDGPATRTAVMAFQRVQRLPSDGIAGPLTRDALRDPLRPVARSNGRGRHIEIDLARQLLLRVRDGRVTHIYAATTGMSGHVTPAGSFRIATKQTTSYSNEYRVWMRWASYFETTRGLAIHAGEIRPTPASHGCVRVPAVFARQIYDSMPIGTAVLIK
jgi:hypothetical protein